MKRILAMLMAVIMLVAVCALTGCGDKGKTDPTTTSSKVDEKATEVTKENVDPKQAAYEELFNDPTKMELNAKNVTAVGMSNGVKFMEAQAKESGDMKMTMYLSETLGYTSYTIGEDSYVEMHIPEYKDENGKTVKAEDVYYKTKGDNLSTSTTDINTDSLIESLQLSKENIKSVKYVETKEIEGIQCDVVEVVHNITTNTNTDTDLEKVDTDVNAAIEDETKSNDSNKNDENSAVAEAVEGVVDAVGEAVDTIGETEDPTTATETTEITSTFYFTSDGNKLFGYSSDVDGMHMDCYFPTDLTIELPKDIKFVDATDEQVSEKMMALYTAMFSQADSVDANNAEDSLSE